MSNQSLRACWRVRKHSLVVADTCLLDQMLLLQQQQQLLARGQQHCPSIANQRKLVASSGCRAARRAAQRKLFTPAATAAPAAEAAPGAAKGGRPRKYAPRKPKDAEEQQAQQDEPDLPVVRSQQKQASSNCFVAALSTWVASACLKDACHNVGAVQHKQGSRLSVGRGFSFAACSTATASRNCRPVPFSSVLLLAAAGLSADADQVVYCWWGGSAHSRVW